MKNKVLERAVDELNRLVLPKEMREPLGIQYKDYVLITYQAGTGTLKIEKAPSGDFAGGPNQTITQIDQLGRISLRKKFTNLMGINAPVKLLLTEYEDCICAEISPGICCICGSSDKIIAEYQQHSICQPCLSGFQTNLMTRLK